MPCAKANQRRVVNKNESVSRTKVDRELWYFGSSAIFLVSFWATFINLQIRQKYFHYIWKKKRDSIRELRNVSWFQDVKMWGEIIKTKCEVSLKIFETVKNLLQNEESRYEDFNILISSEVPQLVNALTQIAEVNVHYS